MKLVWMWGHVRSVKSNTVALQHTISSLTILQPKKKLYHGTKMT